MAPYFSDPDSDTLTYSAVSTDTGFVTAAVSGSIMELTPVSAGSAIARVTAGDPGGVTATQPIVVTVGEGDQSDQPDLVVDSRGLSSPSVAPGASFTLSATVRNRGAGAAAPTSLRYYRSSDATVSGSDTQVGSSPVSGLATGGSASPSIDLTAPDATGMYYYGVCVDTVANESDATNNCLTSVRVDVAEAGVLQGNPDLVVAPPSVSDEAPAPGATFTLSATVRNSGDGAAAATTLRYYRSTDTTISTSDTTVGMDDVTGLAASGSSSASVDLAAPSTAGTYYYGACVDAVSGESDTTNNCSASVRLSVAEPSPQGNPDLMVASPSVSDSAPAPGATFTLSATVRNSGNGAAAATTLRYYRSTDTTITTAAAAAGTAAVAGPGRFRKQQRVGRSDRAVDRRDLRLRRMRGRGDGRVGHRQQLLDCRPAQCRGAPRRRGTRTWWWPRLP